MSQKNHKGVDFTPHRFVQQTAAVRLDSKPRVLLFATPEIQALLEGSQWFDFIPRGTTDARMLREMHNLDGVLVYFEPEEMDNAKLDFMDVVERDFPELPCLALCHRNDPKGNARHGWRAMVFDDMNSASEIEARLKLELFLFPCMKREVLRKNLGVLKHVPAKVAEYQRIVRRLQNSEIGLDYATGLIKLDPALSAHLIQIASAAAFSPGRPVENVEDAVAILGTVKLQAILASAWAFFMIDAAACPGFKPKEQWIHALETAWQVRQICEYERVDPQAAETAVIAGLFHDLGKLVLASKRPTHYTAILKKVAMRHGPTWQMENQVLGFNHAEVGGCLLAMWGAPLAVAEEVLLHHSERPNVWSPAYLIQRVHPKNVGAIHPVGLEEADPWGCDDP